MESFYGLMFVYSRHLNFSGRPSASSCPTHGVEVAEWESSNALMLLLEGQQLTVACHHGLSTGAVGLESFMA
jgi:hypothetical protein